VMLNMFLLHINTRTVFWQQEHLNVDKIISGLNILQFISIALK
jgi:hypothetical protein